MEWDTPRALQIALTYFWGYRGLGICQGKTRRGPNVSLLADIETLHTQEVKVKSET